nr:MCE family protein [Pseudonocardia spinosispora]
MAVVCVVALLVAATGWWLLRAPSGTVITAYFDRAVGLYAGSDVRVLGVKVGKVTDVTPAGSVVRVALTVDDEFPIPPNASAAVVASSLVSDRYVQLTPAYVDGPVMRSGTVIPRERTETPVEIDELLHSVNQLSTALGPDGANKTGALSAAVDTAAANLRGNGTDLNATLTRLGALAGTLSHSRGDLFATIDNLNKFTGTLAESDAQVRDFQSRLAAVSSNLGSQSDQVGHTLDSLAGALGRVNDFVGENRELVSSNVHRLTGITRALADEKKALSEVIDVAPLGASNFLGSYDAASGSVAVRLAVDEFGLTPDMLVCTILQRYTPDSVPSLLRDGCVRTAQGLDKLLPLPTVGQTLGDLQKGALPLPGGTR